ncbi:MULTISPECIES: GntR family transcriptional regulator [unclassified Gordonia (in: high G+C Gram-positive bacteria)]|uniref:GntR family transcriptional regulator n=1 Tax=unclassified Gordonia (in: high G+C Gram-positive bacteria) TaxID=2657482 RepID=UPI001FFE7A4D|nr:MULTISPECIES: GntR family transcriptional regulator [unclassified Gordonia (in: high G+C Gram-positive bacteria)]UQE74937.1 GntR family transcriptional regulator [Gordonia sp. PP30]
MSDGGKGTASTPADKAGTGTADLVEAIRAIIADQGLVPGDRVGAERDLAENLKVSRWAIRRALSELEGHGEVLRSHGRSGGVFVAPEKLVRRTPLVGLPKYLQQQGIESGTVVLSTRTAPADEDVAAHLRLEPDSWVFYIDRLRLADGIPLVIEEAAFPSDMFPGLLDRSLSGSLYELFESEYDLHRGVAVEEIAARSASREVAGLLQVSAGAPLISITRVTELDNGRPFEYSKELYRSDRTTITVRSGPDGCETAYIV